MQTVDAAYERIRNAGDWWAECKAVIDGITFGEDSLQSMEISSALFDGAPELGGAIAGEVKITMTAPGCSFRRMGKIEPFVRICNETERSSWIPKGVYYIDTRKLLDDGATLELTGYDAMLRGETPYPIGRRGWPAKDADVLGDIAAVLGVTIDPRTVLGRDYSVPIPVDYTCREVLGQIAAAYGGTFLISDQGQLRLVTLDTVPEFPRVIGDELPIEIGGVCILV